MQDIQQIFVRVQEAKKKQKDIMTLWKDALKASLEYQEVSDKLKNLREKKKQLETTIREQFSEEFTKLEDIKIDIASDMELLSDTALSQFMKGETVQVKDQYENEYEPVFVVRFKKIK